jgi:hypothetical protein
MIKKRHYVYTENGRTIIGPNAKRYSNEDAFKHSQIRLEANKTLDDVPKIARELSTRRTKYSGRKPEALK